MEPDSSPHDEIERFEEQYRSQPDSLVFARLADAYRKVGESEKALQVLREGLDRHPDYASGHIVRARTLRDMGRLDDAALSLRKVLELDGENLVAVRELGTLADERGELSEARHWYERLVQVDPTNDEAAARLADLERALALPEDEATEPEIRAAEAAEDHVAAEDVSEWWNDPVQALPDDAPVPLPVDSTDMAVGEPPAATGGDGDDDVLEEEEVVAAILNGDVPGEIRAEDTWWYEERDEEPPEDSPPEPSSDADLLTRTMADLYADQGLHAEAAEIYEELLRDSPDDSGLRERLTELQAQVRARATDRLPASPAEDGGDEPTAVPAVWPDVASSPGHISEAQMLDGALAEPPRASGPPVAEEIRRILRIGEDAAAALPDPELDAAREDHPLQPPLESAAADEAVDEAPKVSEDDASGARPSDLSPFTRAWLSDLEGGG